MVGYALAGRWRRIDTARMHGNEAEVGAAIRDAETPRDQVFLISRI